MNFEVASVPPCCLVRGLEPRRDRRFLMLLNMLGEVERGRSGIFWVCEVFGMLSSLWNMLGLAAAL